MCHFANDLYIYASFNANKFTMCVRCEETVHIRYSGKCRKPTAADAFCERICNDVKFLHRTAPIHCIWNFFFSFRCICLIVIRIFLTILGEEEWYQCEIADVIWTDEWNEGCDVPSLRHFQEHIFINRTLGGSWHAPNWEGPRNNRLALQTTHTQPAGEALKSIHAQNLRYKNRQRSDATLNHLNSSIRLFTQKHFIDHEHAP